ncbi:hypothetical protein SAMN04490357_5383 [Streptomyces misionensis]|uniref:Uncharacterized protein n=1 Tax=Streptomyces misionensis TaxID=67331 RepID=A0A1H5CD16_9ACTN|nr:hypothetical protein [Streptomyces misionensis]SED64467.1 hypothetical protein SAMN04490357_5383 [Streptomyces misionensis]
MGLFDRLTGTQHPAEGVSPVTREEMRGVLLGLNQPDVPYVIRYSAGEQCDLVAEWRLTEPAWRQVFAESQITHAVRIRMRLVREGNEVRALEEQWEIARNGSPAALELSKQYTRGPSRTVSRRWTVGRRENGHLEMAETFRFDSAQLRDPLRDTVLQSGWTWRGVVFGKL